MAYAILPVLMAALAGTGDPRLPALDTLETGKIPAERRWTGQPKELVAVLGDKPRPHSRNPHYHITVVFPPDGKGLAHTASETQDRVQVWDFSGSEAKALPVLETPGPWAVSPDGKKLVSARDGELLLWDLPDTKPGRVTLQGATQFWNLAFSPDGKHLASGHFTSEVRIWELGKTEAHEKACLKGHQYYITGIRFTPDGKRLFTGSYREGAFRSWDWTAAKKETAVLQVPNWTSALALSKDGRTLIIAGSDQVLKVWDVSGPQPRETGSIPGHRDFPYLLGGVCFLPGSRLISLSTPWISDPKGESTKESYVAIWDVPSGRKVKEFALPGFFHTLDVAPDGRHVAVIHENTLVYILRLDATK